MSEKTAIQPQCAIPSLDAGHVTLAHGGGGRMMKSMVEQLLVSTFDNELLSRRHDSAVFAVQTGRLAFTTDSYVVHPLFFPGGDIGALAVTGTVNDLAMAGAQPRHISCGLILEEGFSMESLTRIVHSMKQTADRCGVGIVTGDTKVVDRGKGDGVYINTSGVGVIPDRRDIQPSRVRPGDAIVVSGDIGRHGIAIMAVREGLEFETTIESDCMPLHSAVESMFAGDIEVHCLRDLTRGGLGAAVTEIADTAEVCIEMDETAIPVDSQVRGACEILGLDPIFVACEGRFVAFVPNDQKDRTVDILKRQPNCHDAAIIGEVKPSVYGKNGAVITRSSIGTRRILDLPSGEQLPRIC